MSAARHLPPGQLAIDSLQTLAGQAGLEGADSERLSNGPHVTQHFNDRETENTHVQVLSRPTLPSKGKPFINGGECKSR